MVGWLRWRMMSTGMEVYSEEEESDSEGWDCGWVIWSRSCNGWRRVTHVMSWSRLTLVDHPDGGAPDLGMTGLGSAGRLNLGRSTPCVMNPLGWRWYWWWWCKIYEEWLWRGEADPCNVLMSTGDGNSLVLQEEVLWPGWTWVDSVDSVYSVYSEFLRRG